MLSQSIFGTKNLGGQICWGAKKERSAFTKGKREPPLAYVIFDTSSTIARIAVDGAQFKIIMLLGKLYGMIFDWVLVCQPIEKCDRLSFGIGKCCLHELTIILLFAVPWMAIILHHTL